MGPTMWNFLIFHEYIFTFGDFRYCCTTFFFSKCTKSAMLALNVHMEIVRNIGKKNNLTRGALRFQSNAVLSWQELTWQELVEAYLTWLLSVLYVIMKIIWTSIMFKIMYKSLCCPETDHGGGRERGEKRAGTVQEESRRRPGTGRLRTQRTPQRHLR